MSTDVPVAVQPVPRGGLGRMVGRRVVDWLPALVVFVGLVALWQGLIVWLHVQQFLLPKPTSIATTFWTDKSELWHAGWYTFQEALGGFALGSGFAILVALVLARWRPLATALLPYAVAANAIPIIAFAPITNQWFGGGLTKSSKIAIAAVLCFFPVLVNTLRGLTSVRPQDLELMRSYAAGNVEIFRRVRIPTALPFIFAGLKVATVLAMIGAVVGEYFGGALNAIGVLILSRSRVFQFNEAWAGVLVVCLFGLALYIAVALIERLALRWVPSTSE
ncbi:MAG: ABC transporter permease [Actinobacteria bacterium]|nr:MAG: ABC transporter permease [Actinomycetota bacterium]